MAAPDRTGKDSAGPEPAQKARLDDDFTQLYKAHLRDVYSYAYYRVGNHHDAEDLTEQTFLQAYRHFERAQRESRGRPLRPWLIRIAHNLAANYYRDRSRRPQTPIDDAGALSTLHTTESLVEDRDDLARILAGVQELPDDRREALIMRFALGMDNREIARALGRTDGATKVLIHRAIRQLEEVVAAKQGPTEGHERARLRAPPAPGAHAGRPARRPRGAPRDDARRDRRAGRRRARGVGADRVHGPAQLGAHRPPGRGRRDRHRRRRRPRRAAHAAQASPPAGPGARRAGPGRPHAARLRPRGPARLRRRALTLG